MAKNNDISISVIIVIIVCVFAVFGTGVYVHAKDSNTRKAYHARYERMVKGTSQYTDKYRHDRRLLFNSPAYKHDPVISSMADNQHDNKMVQTPMTKFFRIMYDYDDHTDYIDRPIELHGIATQNVYGNKTVFDNDKDNSGESIVDNEQLHSRFNSVDTYIADQSDDKLTVIADVTFSAWTNGNQSNEGNDIYQMTFDKGSHKITGMKKLMHIANVENE